MKMAKATNDDMGRMFNFFDNLDEVLGDAEFGEIVSAERLGAIVKKHWGNHGPGVGASWNRVLWGMDTLLRNCTDPEADTLEWRADIREWLEATGDGRIVASSDS